MRPRRWLTGGVVLAAVSCASTHPKGKAVEVMSDPPGATASAGEQKVRTPGKLYADSDATEMEIKIQKEGYEAASVTLTRNGLSFNECFSQGLNVSFAPPPGGTTVNVGALAIQAVEQLLLLAIGCEMNAEGLRPSPVFVTLTPIPPRLISPRD